jgi:hypothetical protein
MSNEKQNYAMVHQPNTSKVVVVQFWEGYRIYADLQVLIGGDHTDRIMRLIVDYCQFDASAYYKSLVSIVNLPTTNPNNIIDVDEMIMSLGRHVYATFFKYHLFAPNQIGFGYRLHQVMNSGKLALFHKLTL